MPRPDDHSATTGRLSSRLPTWAEASLVALAALALLLLMDAYVRDSPFPKNDELIYERMAEAPFEAHTFPFAYRVLVPTLVHLLPFDHGFSFSALAWLATAACGGLVYVLVLRFGGSKWLAAALGICLALSPTLLVASLREGRNVDPESVLVMLAGALAIVERRAVVFGAIALAGAMVRESTLFLVPLAYAVWTERPWDPVVLRRVLATSAPAILAYAALRLAVPSLYREQVIGYDSALGGRVDVVKTTLKQPFTAARRVFLAYGPLWGVAPFALRDLPFARRGLVLVAGCLVSMTFALDWGRIILLAAPIFFVAAGWVLRDRPRLAALVVAAFMAMNVVYMVYMEDFGGAQEGIIDTGPARYPAE